MDLIAERAYPTPFANSTLLPLLLLSLAGQRHSPDSSKIIKKEYDYVIVGAGTAGSVVASRLSEEPCASVLLLEAGDKPPLLSDIPAISYSFLFTDLDWQFKTVPQKHTARSLVNRQVIWNSGKTLGGSSILNGNLYVRGNRKNYDDWEAHGAKGWSYKDIYPYFLKLEDNKDYKFLANGYHTSGGPVTVHQPRYEWEMKQALRKAVTKTGYKFVDSNADRQTGFYDLQGTLRDSQRCSTAKAYLVPAENRTNLDILPNALATKILIKNRQATGVRFVFRGRTYEVKARKEVIVSAGTVKTPQLLMLSGVGPKKELQRLHIPVEADLPVGRNLQDHGIVFQTYALNPHTPTFDEKLLDQANIYEYMRNRTGPLASTAGITYMAFLKDQEMHPKVDFPNYQLYLGEITTNTLRDMFGIKPQVFRKVFGPYENQPLLMCMSAELQPKSRGTVTLKSKNPYDSPVIDPNYVSDPRDVDDLVQGLKTCQRIASSAPLRRKGVRPLKTLIPGCEKYAYHEDRYFRCQVKSIFLSLHHPVGTVKMGDPLDPTTVVDPELRVKNIKGLRVIDASVMPTITSGNVNIPTIMIAEKASDILKKTINCYEREKKYGDEKSDVMDWTDDGESWKHEKEWNSPEYTASDEDKELWEDKNQWEKPEDKESIWVEEPYTDVPEKTWEEPVESWSKKGKVPLNNLWMSPVETSWSKNEDDSEDDYKSVQAEKASWTMNNPFSSTDDIKESNFNTSEVYSDDYSKQSLPYSWYKKQVEKIVKEVKQPDYLKKDDGSYSRYKEKEEQNLKEIEQPDYPEKDDDSYSRYKEKAERILKEVKQPNYSEKDDDSYSVYKEQADKILKEVKQPNYSEKDDDSYSLYKEQAKQILKEAKQPDYPEKDDDSYSLYKEKAERILKEVKQPNYSHKYDDSYSMYKEQAEQILKEIEQPDYPEKDDDSYSRYKEKAERIFKKVKQPNYSEKDDDSYSLYKEQAEQILKEVKQPDYPEKDDDSYSRYKEKAERILKKVKQPNYSEKDDDSYSVYKEQAEQILKEIKQPDYIKKDDDSYSRYKEKAERILKEVKQPNNSDKDGDSYSRYKEKAERILKEVKQPDYPEKDDDSYSVYKEQAEQILKEIKQPDYINKDDDSYSLYKEQAERILKELKQPDYREKDDDSYSPWKGPDSPQISRTIEELVKLADKTYQN